MPFTLRIDVRWMPHIHVLAGKMPALQRNLHVAQASSLQLVFGLLLYLISIPLGSCFLILAIFLDIFLLF
jgi:hypothetical protein